MATMRFSVPDEVRDRFEQAFLGHDRSAVVTGLLLLAIQAEERRRRRSLSLVERLRRVGEGAARPLYDPVRPTVLEVEHPARLVRPGPGHSAATGSIVGWLRRP